MRSSAIAFAFFFVAFYSNAHATSTACKVAAPSSAATPHLAAGYTARLVASGLSSPRGIKFDKEDHLLVIEQNKGLTSYTLTDDGGSCVSVASSKTLVANADLNHGLELAYNENTVFASTPDTVYSWAYNATSNEITGEQLTIVTNMTNTDHVTRTLRIWPKMPDLLIVTRGSTANIDPIAQNISSGHSQIKTFRLFSPQDQPYNFDTDGELWGWGLRNDVGVDVHPVSSGIFSVENSVDQMTRDGVDIHENNPGEELNFLGYLNGTFSENKGGNFGYPQCFSAWNISEIPDNAGIKVGTQFAIGAQNHTLDLICRNEKIAPRLVFQAHMAPLDILFNNDGSEAWVTFHGSWDRSPPVGYKLTKVAFDKYTGEPIYPPTSTTAAIDVLTNESTVNCPTNCFRPVGLAFDSKGRLFMSSDWTGEIYVITTADGTSIAGVEEPTPASTTGAAASVSTHVSSNSANRKRSGLNEIWWSIGACLAPLI